ncbi:MAG: ABC transporter ATP-binding protein [Actinobacteria bacterium]|jgi:branched-chain amino acid transport system ATP-binding protein|nr:ABC transporter ATP-binding protein [Actinomycetota bacterium]NCU89236.1 ABC transporter ATP-binding protein [Actinomycetota bacterium]NDE53077.1 ABC transporter ATP-binding protein [Actinomycetota bacterium]
MNALELADVSVRINQAQILHGVSFTAPKNQVTALLGRNGVGKSSTLKAIMSLYSPTGSIKLNGTELIGTPTHAIAASGVAYVPEDREIFATLSVKENLSLASRSKISSEKMSRVFEIFPDLSTRQEQRAGTLSGGQQQMLSLSRALLNDNQILLVDEPTKGLAPKLVTEVADALAEVAKRETMILVEQNLALVKRIAQKIVVMDQGKIIFEGAPEKLSDSVWVQSVLGVSNRGKHS